MLRAALRLAWGLYALALFATLLVLAGFAAILLPTVKTRRDASRALARLFFTLWGIGCDVHGLERLPDRPCVVVANHASYVDGPLLYAALPPRFGFVIKKEIANVPLAGWLLRRLGHEFVDRHNKAESSKDARRILKTATSGNSVVFFQQVLRFHRDLSEDFPECALSRVLTAPHFFTARRLPVPNKDGAIPYPANSDIQIIIAVAIKLMQGAFQKPPYVISPAHCGDTWARSPSTGCPSDSPCQFRDRLQPNRRSLIYLGTDETDCPNQHSLLDAGFGAQWAASLALPAFLPLTVGVIHAEARPILDKSTDFRKKSSEK